MKKYARLLSMGSGPGISNFWNSSISDDGFTNESGLTYRLFFIIVCLNFHGTYHSGLWPYKAMIFHAKVTFHVISLDEHFQVECTCLFHQLMDCRVEPDMPTSNIDQFNFYHAPC